LLRLLPAAGVILVACAAAFAQSSPDLLVSDLKARVPGLTVIELPASGQVTLAADQSLTVEALRGVKLDDTPPVLGSLPEPYEAHLTDAFAPGEAPYWAQAIEPFRFDHFTVEFCYGGWHNLQMIDYAATHGFSVTFHYVMPDQTHLPEGTKLLSWGDFTHWHEYFNEHNLTWERWDQLADRDVVADLLPKAWEYDSRAIAMLDLEHGGALSPDDLRAQGWYPASGTAEEQAEFEQKYYEGYLKTFTGPLEALKRKGWTSVGIYPQPYGSGYFNLLGRYERGESALPDPETYWPWLRYGKAMAEAEDVAYPDVYMYYWTPQNVAYALARLDFDQVLLQSLPEPKPLRPYYWPLLHGGDAEPHWWAQQPHANEDMRALTFLTFFAGTDGLVIWNWSGTGNHQAPPPLWSEGASTCGGDVAVEGGIGANAMVGKDFELRPEGAGEDTPPTRIRRYDVLAIESVNEAKGLVRFQHIETALPQPDDRLDPARPFYVMEKNALLANLRAPAEAVSGAVEGLALAKAFEELLKFGEPKVDIPAIEQFAQTLPIVRRVQLGDYSLIATYDPKALQHEERRTIELKDFAGQAGLTLLLPADDQVRAFLVKTN